MPVFKNEDNSTWYVMARYVNWKGERKQKCKRGFATKKEAQEWERMFQLQNSSDLDMSFEAFTELYINDVNRNSETLLWELQKTETELWKEPPEPLLEKISKIFSSGSTEWNGTATELCECLSIDCTPNVLTRKLNVNAGRLYNEYGIRYESGRSRSERTIKLVRLLQV